MRGGGSQNAVMTEANREVARRTGHEAQSIQPLTEAGELLALHHLG